MSNHYAKDQNTLGEAKASPFLRARTRKEREQEETVSKRYRRLVAIRKRAS